jgi:hypothetical protein
MTRKGEITYVRSVGAGLSEAQLTCSLRRDDLRFVLFCFARAKDAEAFAKRFGGAVAGDVVAAPRPSPLVRAAKAGRRSGTLILQAK